MVPWDRGRFRGRLEVGRETAERLRMEETSLIRTKAFKGRVGRLGREGKVGKQVWKTKHRTMKG